jgi:hypothetical protein
VRCGQSVTQPSGLLYYEEKFSESHLAGGGGAPAPPRRGGGGGGGPTGAQPLFGFYHEGFLRVSPKDYTTGSVDFATQACSRPRSHRRRGRRVTAPGRGR